MYYALSAREAAKIALMVHVVPSVTNELHSVLKEKSDEDAIFVFADRLQHMCSLAEWSTDELAKALRSSGLGKCASLLIQKSITGRMLSKMNLFSSVIWAVLIAIPRRSGRVSATVTVASATSEIVPLPSDGLSIVNSLSRN